MTARNPEIEFVDATPALVEAYYGKPAPFTFRGHVALLDGKPVGVGGVYYDDGNPVAFSDMGEEMRARKRDIVRAIRLLKRQFDASKAALYAVASREEATSQSLLARLGFQPTGRMTEHGPLMVRMSA